MTILSLKTCHYALNRPKQRYSVRQGYINLCIRMFVHSIYGITPQRLWIKKVKI